MGQIRPAGCNLPISELTQKLCFRSLGIFLPEGSNAQKKLTAERWKNAIMHLINRKKLQKDEGKFSSSCLLKINFTKKLILLLSVFIHVLDDITIDYSKQYH